ncbi:MAG: metallophosphoesterase [Burkholderiaceae bacterium]|nr:metallophosphoesterase [Burkholderiaceae bacterium]
MILMSISATTCAASATATTTLEQTIIPVAVPANSPKILPNEVSKFSKYGYGVWKAGDGIPYEKRFDLLPKAYEAEASKTKKVANLLRFFSMSDIHITDVQSPAQTINFGMQAQPGMSSAYSPTIPYTTHVLDAAVQTVNLLHKKQPFDFGIFLGDAINNSQHNELRWYIDIIDGGNINPNSDPKSKPSTDYMRPYEARGLDKTIPWYQVMGNHDHFWSGVEIPNDYIKQTVVGENILNMGDIIKANKDDLNSRGFYMGVVDVNTSEGKVINFGAVAGYSTPPKVNANAQRFIVSRNQWIAEFFNTVSNPIGHGFSQDNVKTGFASYTFEPKAGLPLKVIALDDTDCDTCKLGNGALGYLDKDRYDWLVHELDKGQAEGKLMIVAAHVPVGVSVPGFSMFDSASSPKEDALIAKLHNYPNLIMWISGHRHFNSVTAMPSPDANRPELGFWVVETASLRDFPQQFRYFDIVRNSDNTVSIFTTNVDPVVKPGSPAAKSRSYGIATGAIFNSWPPYSPSGAYNAELFKKLSPEMQEKIQKY